MNESSNSYVSLRSHNTSQEVGMIMLSYRARVTENAALDFPIVQTLSELTLVHLRLMVLERIGLYPDSYPKARCSNRRKRPIENGKPLYEWISEQSDIKRHGITAEDVSGLLIEARRIMEVFGQDFDITLGFHWLPSGKINK